MKLFKFEQVKWFKSLKNRFLILFLLLLTVSFGFLENLKQKQNRADYIALQGEVYNELNDRIIELQMSSVGQIEEDERLTKIIKLNKRAMEGLNEEYKGMNQADTSRSLIGRIDYQKTVLELVDLGEDVPKNVDIDIIEQTVKQEEFCLENGIQPMKYQVKFSALNSTQKLLEKSVSIFLLVVVILLFFDFVCLEYEQKHFRFLFIQPFERIAFIRQKLLAAFCTAVCLFFSLISLNFLLSWFMSKELGSFFYPIFVTEHQQLVLWQYGLWLFIFAVLWIACLLLLLCFLSIWMKKSLLVLVFSLCILLFPTFMLYLLEINRTILSVLPTNYISLKSILENSPTVTLFNHAVFKGICVLLGTITILVKVLSVGWKRVSRTY